MQLTKDDFKIITFEGQEGVFIPKEKFDEILTSLQTQEGLTAAQAELLALLDEGFEFNQRSGPSRDELHERR